MVDKHEPAGDSFSSVSIIGLALTPAKDDTAKAIVGVKLCSSIIGLALTPAKDDTAKAVVGVKLCSSIFGLASTPAKNEKPRQSLERQQAPPYLDWSQRQRKTVRGYLLLLTSREL